MYTISIAVTVVFYALIGYLSYVTASILYTGLRYKLILPTIKSTLFIGVTYISIISDVILFGNFMYSSISMKNGLLLILTVVSLITASGRKESKNEHKRE
ncbi:hypothetical protein P59_059 [Bacillus phage P59]|nr:hypothetical protein P59_059 [Bacillus phage P59]